MSKATIKAEIDANITQNGTGAITGNILNGVLNDMVDDYATQEEVTSLDQKTVEIKNAPNTDLDIADEKNNVLARFKNGHIRTKNFDSKDVAISIKGNDFADFDIADEKNNVLARFKNGHIRTKYFNSANVYETGSKSISANNDVIVAMHRSGICTTNYNGVNVFPEESIWALIAAKRCGVKYVEFDLCKTSDGHFVCIHDYTINRTMQYSDGGTISSSINVSSLTLQELKENYVYKSSVPQHRSPILTLEEYCDACRQLELIPYYHGDNLPEDSEVILQIISKYCKDFVFFMSRPYNIPYLLKARKEYPNILIVYDDDTLCTAEYMISVLDSIGGRCACSINFPDRLSEEFAHAIVDAGYYMQCSCHNGKMLDSIQKGCNMVLEDWIIPNLNLQPFNLLSLVENVEDFEITGSYDIDTGIISMSGGDSVTIPLNATFLAGFELILNFKGSLLIKSNGAGSQEVSSQNENIPIIFKRAIIQSTDNVIIEATDDTTINNIIFKQYKF